MKTLWYGLLLLALVTGACNKKQLQKRSLHPPNEIGSAAGMASVNQPIKAHLRNGQLAVLNPGYVVDQTSAELRGEGKLYDVNRKLLSTGLLQLPLDSIVLYEANENISKRNDAQIAALTILTAASVGVAIYCFAQPKACFGSCPTFYLDPNQTAHYADAEAFSNAIAPSLEYVDVDALGRLQPSSNEVVLTVKNEAIETHCIRRAELLGWPVQVGERVFQTRKQHFYLCGEPIAPMKASGPEGDVTALLQRKDLVERFSLADERSLIARESVELLFDGVNEEHDLGLVLGFRQTLMTTYFIYSAMGYMGDEVGDYFASIERSEKLRQRLRTGIKDELGDLEVHVFNQQTQRWEYQGGFYETGPIAINTQLQVLKQKAVNGQLRIKLVMNKGLWRIDYAGLVQVKSAIEPHRLALTKVSEGELDRPDLLRKLVDSTELLVTFPGDVYGLHYRFPFAAETWELFLEGQGYYLEWMREQWLEEKNTAKLRQMFMQPARYLKSETAAYKKYETTMEEAFWGSRIEKNMISHED